MKFIINFFKVHLKKTEKTEIHHFIKHETKKDILLKFLILFSILILYTGYLSYEYGFANGGILSVLTWSFFVMCTPVADAGFLLDFPMRILFRIRMVISELVVWAIAFFSAIITLLINPEVYEKTVITQLFKDILINPWPYWGIIILSIAGTFLSVRFGDELMDFIKHEDCNFRNRNHIKHELIIIGFIFIFIFTAYTLLLQNLGITIEEVK